jgi:hypothetical protein
LRFLNFSELKFFMIGILGTKSQEARGIFNSALFNMDTGLYFDLEPVNEEEHSLIKEQTSSIHQEIEELRSIEVVGAEEILKISNLESDLNQLALSQEELIWKGLESIRPETNLQNEIDLENMPELDITEADLETASVLYFRETLLKLKQEFTENIENENLEKE